MRAHTRKHLTKDESARESIPWRNAFEDLIDKYTEAGCMLKGCRLRENLTQKQLSDQLHIEQCNISLMERGKRPIGKAMAKKLAKFFKTDYKIFL